MPKSPAEPRPKPGSVSLCMIVRDEAATLAECLRAARPFVDEIVVVDTGSVDDTPRIAADAGARVVTFKWDDDFAAARNVSLEAATCSWVLVLDADEILAPETGRELRSAAARSDVSGCFLPIVNRYDDDGSSITALILRAWRSSPEVRFRGRIHEQTSWAVLPRAKETRTRLVALRGAVIHDGYRPAVVAARGKNERNLRLFERAIAEAPDDLYMTWKFADFLRRFPERSDQATTLLDAGVRAVRALDPEARKTLPFAAEFFALRAERLRASGDAGAARALAEEGLSLTEITPNLAFAAANAALAAGDGVAAEKGFRSCLEMGDAPRVVPGQPGTTGVRAKRGILLALRAQSRFADVVATCEEMLAEAPRGGGAEDLWETWFDAVVRDGRAKDALAFVSSRLKLRPDDAASWSTGARLLEALGVFGDAAKWRLRAASIRMNGPDPLRAAAADLGAAAACRTLEGDVGEALRLAISARVDPRARAVAAIAYAVAGEPSPGWIDATDPALRASFRALVSALSRMRGAAGVVYQRLCAAAENSDVFDPTVAALLGETSVDGATTNAAIGAAAD